MKAAAAIFAFILSAVLAAAAGAAEQGNVYLWVDKDGTPHYQDRPPEGADPEMAKALSMRYKMTDAEAQAAANKRQAETTDLIKLRESQQADDKKARTVNASRLPRRASRDARRRATRHRNTRPRTGSTSRARTGNAPT